MQSRHVLTILAADRVGSSDLLRRLGVEVAEALIRDLESSVHLPTTSRCGAESTIYHGVRCILPPGHQGSCRSVGGAPWMRIGGRG